jgi:hypothetical protein
MFIAYIIAIKNGIWCLALTMLMYQFLSVLFLLIYGSSFHNETPYKQDKNKETKH